MLPDTPDEKQARDTVKLAALTLAWAVGWRTDPDEPFAIDQIAGLYVKNHRLFSYDFGRPHNGVSGWDLASR